MTDFSDAARPQNKYYRLPHLPESIQLDDYTSVTRIAQGGTSILYKAYSEEEKHDLVLKFMDVSFLPFAENEINILTSLEHENVVRLIPFINNEGNEIHIKEIKIFNQDLIYYQLELIEGVTLDKRIPQEGLIFSEAMNWFEKIQRPISYLHNLGYAHLDLKPTNILINKDDQITIIDFSTAQKFGKPPKNRIFTRYYAAPEYQSKQKNISIDQRADIYSLGLIFIELILGRKVRNKYDILRAVVAATEPHSIANVANKTDPNINYGNEAEAKDNIDVTQILEDVRNKYLVESLVEILSKTIRKDPEDRYISIVEFIERLKAIRDEIIKIQIEIERKEKRDKFIEQLKSIISITGIGILLIVLAIDAMFMIWAIYSLGGIIISYSFGLFERLPIIVAIIIFLINVAIIVGYLIYRRRSEEISYAFPSWSIQPPNTGVPSPPVFATGPGINPPYTNYPPSEDYSRNDYVYAEIKDRQPLIIEESYTLYVGIYNDEEKQTKDFPITLMSDGDEFTIDIVIRGNEININSSWHKSINYVRNKRSNFTEFIFQPLSTGRHFIDVEFYYEKSWLTSIQIELLVENKQLAEESAIVQV